MGVNANVTSDRRLYVDTEASRTTIGSTNFLLTQGVMFTQANGEALIASGTSAPSMTLTGCTVLTAVEVDGAAGGQLQIKQGSTVVWQGTLPSSGGHIGDTFDSGVFFNATLTLTGSGTYQYSVYGDNFTCVGSSGAMAAHLAGHLSG